MDVSQDIRPKFVIK